MDLVISDIRSFDMLSTKIESVLKELEMQRDIEKKREEEGELLPTEERSLAITREEGEFLYLLVKAMNAKVVIEIGTSFGYSTIWLAAAVSEIGGKVISYDVLPKKIEEATQNLNKAGLSDFTELILGDAKELIKKINNPVDVVFLDADKRDYIEFITLALKKLRIGGVILSDNVLDCPEIHEDEPEICEEIMDFINNHPQCSSITIPFLPNGLEMTLRET
jgi:predicted O-methyltransferase YrrM